MFYLDIAELNQFIKECTVLVKTIFQTDGGRVVLEHLSTSNAKIGSWETEF